MRIPENLKLNKFREVAIPRNEEYFGRTGALSMPANMYTGEEFAPIEKNKLDLLADMDEYADQIPIPDDEK